jgi:hypothetical protein
VSADRSSAVRRVRRGEGEVTQWPRGLLEYIPAGVPDSPPNPDEDRLLQRVYLAGRLLALLGARGVPVESEVKELREVDRLRAEGRRPEAMARIDALLARLDHRSEPASGPTGASGTGRGPTA